ncbi:TetR/AcrR family transcriptional regulator [Actinoplanes couchii]|uniref:TetR family transcriptional regulator n=1 Tax=Actinoplanes couchii TaxID=403638 RepID=A0ABQ3XKN8_9ACTN|nr:TetR/AcrR family transcriptional regulator [Actinoplanes couchii]MDR6319537.1 AcrR family transcriptional regulator [Actinoplanes couchii]GID59073.1 TetR family transcriptional regulator [Actinoplanes couchii]
MSRWEPGAADRLHTAALELAAEHGFAAITVPQITARAGLTTRTFFRHFTDKREVLFTGETVLPAVMAEVFAGAPPELTPMEVITTGLRDVVAPRFEGRRENLRLRRGIVQSDEGLRERELRKRSLIAEAGAAGFRDRGLSDLEATLAAQLAATIIDTAVSRWLDEDTERPLADIVLETTVALRSVTGRP